MAAGKITAISSNFRDAQASMELSLFPVKFEACLSQNGENQAYNAWQNHTRSSSPQNHEGPGQIDARVTSMYSNCFSKEARWSYCDRNWRTNGTAGSHQILEKTQCLSRHYHNSSHRDWRDTSVFFHCGNARMSSILLLSAQAALPPDCS